MSKRRPDYHSPIRTALKATAVLERGEYLVKHVLLCNDCHTARVRGQVEPLPGRLFSGGVPFMMGTRTQYSKNLTPHETGPGTWMKDTFIARFRAHTASFPVTEEENSEMDWVAFSGINDEDLGAIWDFLGTLPLRETRKLDRAD